MITIKLKLKSSLPEEFSLFQKKWNNVYRYSFNRFTESKSLFDLYPLLNKINNVDMVDESWKRCAAQQANYLFSTNKNPKTIFGGHKNFFKLKNHKITKEEFNSLRNIKITMTGSKHDKGNRKFKFDTTTFKGSVKLTNKIEFETIRPSKNQINLLTKAIELANNKQLPITYSLDKNYLYISFETDKLNLNKDYKPIAHRCLSIDINPNYIGYSIINNDNQPIYKEVISLKNIKDKNKKKYELYQISKYIIALALHYKVEIIGIEKLNIVSKNNLKGKRFNKAVNNDWCRNLFLNSIRKHCSINNIKCQELITNYSSFIGCINYPNDTDSVAASLELNRRLLLFKKIYLDQVQEKADIVYPSWDINKLPTRWKEMVMVNNILGWKELYQLTKKLKSSYRFLYDDFKESHRVLRFKSALSLVDKMPYLN
jgi:hypothetical protein